MSEPVPAPVSKTTIIGIGIASALVPLNSTMIAVALRSVAEDFDIEKSQARALITIYLIAMLVGQPIAGRISDAIGAKRTTMISLSGFAACSVIAVMSPNFSFLVGARTLQAVFASALSPSVQSMLRSVTSPRERGRAFGILGSVIGVGVAAGPLLGGQLVDSFSWKAIFLVNLPVIAVCFVLLGRVNVPRPAKVTVDIDVDPLAPPSDTPPMWTPVFAAAFATSALSNFGQYTLLLMCPAVLEAQDWDSRSVGRVLTAMTIGIIVMGPIGGRYGDRVGRRIPVMSGLAIAVFGLAMLIPFEGALSVSLLVIALAIFGIGFGFASPGLTASGIEAVPEARTGMAAGWLSMSRYIGSIISTILLSLIVDDDASGSRTMFVIATIVGLCSLLTASIVVKVNSGASSRGIPAEPDAASALGLPRS